MANPTTIPEHFVTEWGINWEHLVQQMDSRLENTCVLDTVNGKEKTYNQIGVTTARPITSRNAPTVATNEQLAKRWLRPTPSDAVTHFDEWDDGFLGEVVLPTSPTVRSHMAAYLRHCDQTLIDGLDGTSYVGETGTTAVTFPAAQEVAVDLSGSSEGLTVAKLLEAKDVLGKNEAYTPGMPDQELCLAISQQQLTDLLANENEVTSADYAAIKALVHGEIDYFAGFRFHRTELLPLASATDIRSCFAYVKDGVVLGRSERSTKFSIRDDLNETLQIRTKWKNGATRLQEEKIVRILCDESP